MENQKPYIVAFSLLVVAILFGAVVLFATRPEGIEIVIIPPEPTATPLPTATHEPITVYITGAVLTPQATISLPYGSRVQDALDAVGGITSDADLDRVNVVGILRDGDQVHVFSLEEAVTITEDTIPTPSGGGIVYINIATLEELDSLPGIGPAIAQRIIDYREANGAFANFDDLMDVSGIGESIVSNLEGLVSFEAP